MGEGVIAGRGKYHQACRASTRYLKCFKICTKYRNCEIISTLRLRGRADDDGWRAGGDL